VRQRLPLDEYGKSALLYLRGKQRRGTIVPLHWQRILREKLKRTGEVAAWLLSLICEWWEPRSEVRGQSEFLSKRFRFNLPQVSYAWLCRKTGWSHNTIRKAFVALESHLELPLVKRFFQDVRLKSGEVMNLMFVAIYPEAIDQVLGWDDPIEDRQDLPEYEVEITADGSIVGVTEAEEPFTPEQPPAPEAPKPVPAASALPAEPPVGSLPNCNREMTAQEMDEVADSQEATKAGSPVQYHDYRDRNLYPAWRNRWGRHGVKPEFLNYLRSEFEKKEWGDKTTPQAWLSSRERNEWTAILEYWDSFLNEQARRAANARAMQAAAHPEPSRANDATADPESDPLSALQSRVTLAAKAANLPFLKGDARAVATAKWRELAAEARDAGLGDFVESLCKTHPIAARTLNA